MQDVAAFQMLGAFASFGARSFVLTFLDLDGAKRGFVRNRPLLRFVILYLTAAGLTERQNSIVIRPRADDVTLVQLDDLDTAALERVRDVSFLTLTDEST